MTANLKGFSENRYWNLSPSYGYGLFILTFGSGKWVLNKHFIEIQNVERFPWGAHGEWPKYITVSKTRRRLKIWESGEEYKEKKKKKKKVKMREKEKKNCLMIHDIHIVNAFNLVVALYLSLYFIFFFSSFFNSCTQCNIQTGSFILLKFQNRKWKIFTIFFFPFIPSPVALFTWVLLKRGGLKSG